MLKKRVFWVINLKELPVSIWVFNLQFVDKIKNIGINKVFKKSCLVIQAYNNYNKNLVLTQSLTLQQISISLIVCFAIMFQNNTTKLSLYNVFQAYIWSTLDINQDFFICPFLKLIIIIKASSNYILKVVKPLYGIPKVSNHWFAIYHNYHMINFSITESTYNSCLLYRYKSFGIIDL